MRDAIVNITTVMITPILPKAEATVFLDTITDENVWLLSELVWWDEGAYEREQHTLQPTPSPRIIKM